MSEGVAVPFGTFLPFEERHAAAFVGRGDEVARLEKHFVGEPRIVVLTGPLGAGKTSLVRAGLTPALVGRGLAVITLGAYRELDRELVRATSVQSLAPPVPGQDPADYLGRIARESQGGLVVVMDHLEEPLSDDKSAAELAALTARLREEGGPRLRFLFSVEESAFARLEILHEALKSPAGARAVHTIAPLAEAQVADILERTAVGSGTPFESGLAPMVAGDLCKASPCRPFDLQLVARAIVDLRLSSKRRFKRSGGAAVLPTLWLTEACNQAGGAVARRALLAAGEPGGVAPADLGGPNRRGHDPGADALISLRGRGLLVSHDASRTEGKREVFTLAHPALRSVIDTFAMADRARAGAARRALRRRLSAGDRLRLIELFSVHRHLRGRLAPDERGAVRRSLTAFGMRAGIAVALAMLLLVILFTSSRRAYTLALDPPNIEPGTASRVVVRLGRPSLSFLDFLPNTPPLGSIIADTGYTTAALGPETIARIAAGKVSGTLERPSTGPVDGEARSPVPNWLREVLNGLRPVPRGVAKAVLGDPDGVVALKQAFSDPAARGEVLSALAVIGRGGAGEDEILAGSLADGNPDIRRRGVAVAAAIARREARQAADSERKSDADAKKAGKRKTGESIARSNATATLRAALGDRSPDVRAAVLQEALSLPPGDAAGIVTLALRDSDPTLRRRAEEATAQLAARAPAAVVDALATILQSSDAGARRGALSLFETIAARDPAACAPVLARVVMAERVPDDARVAALLLLRRTGAPSPALRPALEKAIRPESPPRLRAAALPLYARLISPAEAEEIARDEMKGSPAARAASAAVWGAVAHSRPENADKPLRSMLNDPATETRIEAARAVGSLRRAGLDLTEKALADPSPDVERAALDSAVQLAPAYPTQVADMLGRAVKVVRPAVRKSLIDALAHLGESRPAAVLPSLARAIKDSDGPTRVAATNGFCGMAKKNAAAVAPYLRIAARDERDEVRTAAAACLGEVAGGDPKGAARIAAELAESGQAQVRGAAAAALATVGTEAAGVTLPTLLKLLGDSDPEVRAGAERALAATAPALDKRRTDEAEKALEGALVRGDVAERKLIVAAAAKAGLWNLLRQAARDGDENVRLEAVRAAGARKGPGLEIVRSAVDDSAQTVRAEAMRLLAGASGGGARDVMPTFEAMLRSGDRAAREAAVAGIGELPDAGEPGIRLLGEALSQRSEALRTAAARALGRLADREADRVAPHLERAVRDPAYDVRRAALPGLAIAWSRRHDPRELGRRLAASDTDSTRRFVALEALVTIAQRPKSTTSDPLAARRELDRVAEHGPALARLAARIGRSFVDGSTTEMQTFLERLLSS